VIKLRLNDLEFPLIAWKFVLFEHFFFFLTIRNKISSLGTGLTRSLLYLSAYISIYLSMSGPWPALGNSAIRKIKLCAYFWDILHFETEQIKVNE